MTSSDLHEKTDEVLIREYTEDQEKQVYSLILAIFQIELKNVAPEGYLNDIHAIHEVYGGESNRFWTASLGNRVVGTIAVKEDSEEDGLLRRFFVSPAHRSQGVAKRLFQEAVNFSRKAGYKRLVFIGNSEMQKARKTLIKYGFKEEEEIDLGDIKIFKLIFDL